MIELNRNRSKNLQHFSFRLRPATIEFYESLAQENGICCRKLVRRVLESYETILKLSGAQKL